MKICSGFEAVHRLKVTPISFKRFIAFLCLLKKNYVNECLLKYVCETAFVPASTWQGVRLVF